MEVISKISKANREAMIYKPMKKRSRHPVKSPQSPDFRRKQMAGIWRKIKDVLTWILIFVTLVLVYKVITEHFFMPGG